MKYNFKRTDFPEDFIFGAATAAYQIEGSNFGDCGSSIWDTWAATPGNVVNFEDGSIACDHYNRTEEDLNLIKVGGFDSYRFSASWSRVMPDGRTVNPKGLDFYDKLVDQLLKRGLKPNLTLYHWDLPSALSDIGGWTNREIPLLFADYTEALINRIGDRLDFVSTINEPFCASWLAYFVGRKAPGMRDIRAAMRSMHYIQLAHGLAIETLRGMGQKNLGTVLNLSHSEPASSNELDKAAQQTFDAIGFRWFMDSIFKGHYPEDMLSANLQHMPEGFEDDMKVINQKMDWLGINYYTREIISHVPDQPWPNLEIGRGPLPKTDMGWEIFPQGLEAVLKRVHQDYTDDLPLYITENGMAVDSELVDGECNDVERIDYIDMHMQKVLKCIKDGVPIKGYYGWSLLDNYEWAYGYEKRFGLVHVDYKTQKRTPKASYKAFKHALTEV